MFAVGICLRLRALRRVLGLCLLMLLQLTVVSASAEEHELEVGASIPREEPAGLQQQIEAAEDDTVTPPRESPLLTPANPSRGEQPAADSKLGKGPDLLLPAAAAAAAAAGVAAAAGRENEAAGGGPLPPARRGAPPSAGKASLSGLPRSRAGAGMLLLALLVVVGTALWRLRLRRLPLLLEAEERARLQERIQRAVARLQQLGAAAAYAKELANQLGTEQASEAWNLYEQQLMSANAAFAATQLQPDAAAPHLLQLEALVSRTAAAGQQLLQQLRRQAEKARVYGEAAVQAMRPFSPAAQQMLEQMMDETVSPAAQAYLASLQASGRTLLQQTETLCQQLAAGTSGKAETEQELQLLTSGLASSVADHRFLDEAARGLEAVTDKWKSFAAELAFTARKILARQHKTRNESHMVVFTTLHRTLDDAAERRLEEIQELSPEERETAAARMQEAVEQVASSLPRCDALLREQLEDVANLRRKADVEELLIANQALDAAAASLEELMDSAVACLEQIPQLSSLFGAHLMQGFRERAMKIRKKGDISFTFVSTQQHELRNELAHLASGREEEQLIQPGMFAGLLEVSRLNGEKLLHTAGQAADLMLKMDYETDKIKFSFLADQTSVCAAKIDDFANEADIIQLRGSMLKAIEASMHEAKAKLAAATSGADREQQEQHQQLAALLEEFEEAERQARQARQAEDAATAAACMNAVALQVAWEQHQLTRKPKTP
ncbi:hypothetical protein Efla_001308 [Eimeria flavescens]